MKKSELAELLINDPSILGEGVQWNDQAKRLFWTDIHGKRFLSCGADGADYRVRALDERLCSFAFDETGGILAAFESGLYACDAELGGKKLLHRFESDKPTTRLNDGRCDRQGRFIVGGLDENGLAKTSTVISFDGSAPKTLIEGVGCSNSICFSPDGTVMYFTHTPSRTIHAYDYDPATGDIANQRVFVALGEDEGSPDGSCIDAEGRLWNAQWDGGRVQCYEPDGSKGPTVYLPCPQVTCAAFGGEDLGTLFITSAREDLSRADITKAPLSGAVFAIDAKGLFGAVGLPEARFKG